KREYFATVRKKMFIFMTLFFPVLIAGMMFLMIVLMGGALGEKRIAVIDGTGRLAEVFSKPLRPEAPNPRDAVRGKRNDLPQTLQLDYVDARGKSVQDVAKAYLSQLIEGKETGHSLDAVLVVPSNAFDDPNAKMTFYSRTATDIMSQERLAGVANRAVQ